MTSRFALVEVTFDDNASWDENPNASFSYPANSEGVSGVQSSGASIDYRTDHANFTIIEGLDQPLTGSGEAFSTLNRGGVGIDILYGGKKGGHGNMNICIGGHDNILANPLRIVINNSSSNDGQTHYAKTTIASGTVTPIVSWLPKVNNNNTMHSKEDAPDSIKPFVENDIFSIHITSGHKDNQDANSGTKYNSPRIDIYHTRSGTTTLLNSYQVYSTTRPWHQISDFHNGVYTRNAFFHKVANHGTTEGYDNGKIRIGYQNNSVNVPHPKKISYYHLPSSGSDTVWAYPAYQTESQYDAPNWVHPSPPPTMTITSSTVNSGDTSSDASISVTFTSSGSTTDFVVGDVTVTNGTLSDFSGSGTTYTATFTPTSVSTTTLQVAAGAFTISGSSNAVSNTFSWTYVDTTSPVITIAAGYGDADLYRLSGITTTSTSNFAVSFARTSTNKYSEQGASATDAVDGSRTVTIGGDTVDTTVNGTYIVTYTASDTSGNTKVLSKTVTVTSTHDPLKNAVSIRKNSIRGLFNSVCRAYVNFENSGNFELKTHEDVVGLTFLGSNGRIGSGTTAPEAKFHSTVAHINDITLTELFGSSDRSLKMDIKDVNSELSQDILKLEPVQYNWKKNPEGPIHYGFIAQELLKRFPNLVKYDENSGYSVDYIGIVPLIVKELQKQTEKVDQLTDEAEKLQILLDAILDKKDV